MGEDAHSETSPEGTEEARLRELALLLLAPRHGDTPPGEQPRLLVGQIPPDFPFELPLPEGSRVVGSFVYGQPTIVVETTTSSADAVLRFYRDHLPALGWHEEDHMLGRQGGFISTFMANRSFARFTREESPSTLHLMAFLGPQDEVVAHISLHDDPRPARQPRRRSHPDLWDILPPIEPPPGASQTGGGGSASDDRVESNAYLETDLDLTALAAHYTQQLKQAGWELRDEAVSGPLAWSTWTFQDDESEPWRAWFFILKRPDVAQRFTLHLEAEWASASSTGGGRGGWVTYGHTGPS